MRGSWRPNRTATYWPLLLLPSAFLSRSPGLPNRGPGGPLCWVLAFSTASYLQLVWSPTAQSGAWGLLLFGADFLSASNWISCALSYIIVKRPPFSCGRHKLHAFNPSTVCYSSTGCTCYLYRCISYFDSPAGSQVNIQQNKYILLATTFTKFMDWHSYIVLTKACR